MSNNNNNTANDGARNEALSEDRAKYWLITINASDEDPEGLLLQRSIDDIEDLYDNGELTYAVGQFERGGESNRLHIQAYVICKERKYARWMSARVYRAFLCASRSEWAAKGIKYCNDPKKEGFDRHAFEFGNKPSVTRGRRTDLETVDEAILNGEVVTFREVNSMRVSVAANQSNWAKWRLAEAAKDEYLAEERYDVDYQPYVYQYWLSRILNETKPAERLIMFVVDKLGHSGKTRFCYEFERSSEKRCQTVRAMPKRDMVAALENRREVLFIDVPRGRHKYMDTVYVFMEEAKDGKLSMEKYNSHVLYQPRSHLVVFMNDDVDIGQGGLYPSNQSGVPAIEIERTPPLTHDRYAIWDFNILPGMTEKWDIEGLWGKTCPPFIAFDEKMDPIDYVPPIVNNFGSEFSSDMTGDGPSQSVFTRNPDGSYPEEYLDSYAMVCYVIEDIGETESCAPEVNFGAPSPAPCGEDYIRVFLENPGNHFGYSYHGDRETFCPYYEDVLMGFIWKGEPREELPVFSEQKLLDENVVWTCVPGEYHPVWVCKPKSTVYPLSWFRVRVRDLPKRAIYWLTNHANLNEDVIVIPTSINLPEKPLDLIDMMGR